jgi:DNA-binding transcriptional ArsR family regulator
MEMHAEMIGAVAQRFQALSDELRLRILVRLRQGEANVTALTRELGVSQASVSKHLAVLRQVGLVDVHRRGVQSVYRVKDASVFDMCRIVCDGVVRQLREQQAVLNVIDHKGDDDWID